MKKSFIKKQVFTLLLVSFLLLNLFPARAWALTYEDERELGRQFYLYIRKHLELVQDPDLTVYINNLGQKIVKTAKDQPYTYRFFIVNDESINAFAAPAGYIFVNTGLIKAFQTEGELAATLSHEIAHVTARHLSKRITKSKKLSLATMGAMAAGILIGGPVGTAVVIGSMGANMQAQLKYSRENETEADRQGMDFLIKAGYDPRFMMDSFKILLKSPMSDSSRPTYLRTHPALYERISTVELWAANADNQNVKGQGDMHAFEAAKTKIIARYSNQKFAQSYFDRLLTTSQKPELAYYGLALLKEQQQEMNAAIKYFKNALELEPSHVGIITDLGVALFQKGDYQAAEEYLDKTLSLRPRSFAANYYMGRIKQVNGDLKKAKNLFNRVLAINPGHEKTLYNLGLIYGALGEMGKAHYHTGMYFISVGQPKKAMFHLEKAKKEDLKNSPALAYNINKAIKKIKKSKKSGF